MTGGVVPVAAPRTSHLAVVGMLTSIAAVVLIVAVDVVLVAHGRAMQAMFSLLPLFLIVALAGVGGLLVIRRPGNSIGALLLFTGVLTAVSWGGGYYVDLGDFVGIGRLPLVVPVAWLVGWLFTPTVGLMAAFLPMLYPSGHLPGPRWRILAGVALVAISLSALQSATAPGPLSDLTTIDNPVVPPQPLSDLLQALGSVSLLLAPPVIAIVITNLVIRFRRSVGVERQQMKWFLSVASVAAIAVIFSLVTTGPVSDAGWVVANIAIGCLPLAVGIAILRYRLYDIDRIVSRTVAYGAITAMLVALFLGANLAFEAALASFAHGSTVAVAASTVAVFAAFQPLRRRTQAAVDRRFDRRRYETDRMVAAFADRLRAGIDPERLRLEFGGVLTPTIAPAAAGIWLRGETRDRRVHGAGPRRGGSGTAAPRARLPAGSDAGRRVARDQAPRRGSSVAIGAPHERARRRVATALAVVALVLVAMWLVMFMIGTDRGWVPLDQQGGGQTIAAATILAVSFSVVGWIVLRRQAANRLGWVFLGIGLWQAINTFAFGYSTMAYMATGGDWPFASELSWVGVWAWAPGFVLFCTFGILLFPDGRLPSRRWWAVAAAGVVAMALLAVPIALASWPYRGPLLEQVQMQCCAAIPSDAALEAAYSLRDIGAVLLVIATVGSVAGMAVRFRRSSGVEREQLKWFTYAALIDAAILVVWQTVQLDPIVGTLSAIVLAGLLPVATAVAILRYRLYDIDRLVSRTIAYAVISAILGAVFVAVVLLAQAVVDALLPQVGETGPQAVVASTLVVATFFQPVRRRVQSAVDRRFDRARIDRERAVVRLGQRLRDEVELHAIEDDVLGTVEATVRPADISIWLRA